MRHTSMTCPDCGTELQAADDKCPHCGSDLNIEREKTKKGMGWLLLIIPLVAIVLMWIWIVDMSLVKEPALFLNLVVLATILSTAILVYVESSSLGFGTTKEGKEADRVVLREWSFYGRSYIPSISTEDEKKAERSAWLPRSSLPFFSQDPFF